MSVGPTKPTCEIKYGHNRTASLTKILYVSSLLGPAQLIVKASLIGSDPFHSKYFDLPLLSFGYI